MEGWPAGDFVEDSGVADVTKGPIPVDGSDDVFRVFVCEGSQAQAKRVCPGPCAQGKLEGGCGGFDRVGMPVGQPAPQSFGGWSLSHFHGFFHWVS